MNMDGVYAGQGVAAMMVGVGRGDVDGLGVLIESHASGDWSQKTDCGARNHVAA